MKNIYIAYDEYSNPISVLLSESKDKAELVWMGMNINAVNIEEIDSNEQMGINGVVILLTSKKYKVHVGNGLKTFNVFRRGQ